MVKQRSTVGQGWGWSADDDVKLLLAVEDNAEAAEWGRGRGAPGTFLAFGAYTPN